MKKIKITKITLLIYIGFVVFSCNKEEKEETVTATINIIEPLATDTIAFGDELHIEGSVTGSAEMHGFTVSFIDNSTNITLKSTSYDVHSNLYNFHEHYINNLSDTTSVKAKIDVIKDHQGNHEIKEVNVICLPQ